MTGGSEVSHHVWRMDSQRLHRVLFVGVACISVNSQKSYLLSVFFE